jgi:2-dehydro-3-deoxyphosphogluconate aldolase/(4S)-4-hydroxy-2-oxoglutarate aldolase
MKFFPASVYGGPAALKAFAGPFPDVKFVATGGINGQNYASYLTLSNVLAVGGSWFAPEDGSAENIATEVRALLAATASGTVQPTPSSVEVRA